MILLITASSNGWQLQEALQSAIHDAVRIAPSAGSGLRSLRGREFDLVVIDQSAASETDISTIVRQIGTAVPIYTNLALSSSARVIAEVKSALLRRRAERTAAIRVATAALREDLRNAVTGILLSSELVLSAPSLPANVQEKLRELVQLANGMRRQLEL